ERTRELQLALEAKTEFLNNMSHEVRTPVQGITAISEGLIEHWDSCHDDERKLYASKVAENARRLFSLVSNLLDLSRFTAGKMHMNMGKGDLISLINNMMEECRDLYLSGKEIELEFISSLSSAPLTCDSERMLQVLRNIFANAIKFTSKGKIIARLEECKIRYAITDEEGNVIDYTEADGRAKVNMVEDGYRFSLYDEGIGIPYGEEKSIFDPFTQSTRTKTRAGGTGLGLAICRDIIDAHTGRIWARNNEVMGSTIYFDIPRRYKNRIEGSSNHNVCIVSSSVTSGIVGNKLDTIYDKNGGDRAEDKNSSSSNGNNSGNSGNGTNSSTNTESGNINNRSGSSNNSSSISSSNNNTDKSKDNSRREAEEGFSHKQVSMDGEDKGKIGVQEQEAQRIEKDRNDKERKDKEEQGREKEAQERRERTKTILLIDDEEAAHISMKLMLKDSGYNLITASGGIEGLAVMEAKHNDIDLVLLDLMMPDMYGLNVLAIMREDKNMCHIPVILQTGSSDVGELAKVKSLGVLNHIPKPYDKSLINNIVRDALA
ncbi:MAG: ATP-binding protein, partial [Alphaproteobacteria bacterium]